MAKRGKLPESMLGRTRRLLLSGAKIATKEVASRLAAADRLKTKVQQTEELVRTLSELKGAAMKAGQWFSIEWGDLFPPEVLEVLRQLHDEGSFMPLEQVEKILREELGEARQDLKDLSPEPIAAASIGQVHRAVLRGRPVAVKIQYPGVAKSIDSDLAVLKKTVQMFLSVKGRAIDLEATFEELKEGLKREADYRLEAESLDLYRRAVKNPAFVVPEVFPEHSTSRVLVMSYEEGRKIKEWLGSKPGADAVHAFGELVLELMFEEFFTNGIVQTDPNYGNFLYRPKERALVLLDFGATKSYSAKFREEIRTLTEAAVDRDDTRVLELIFQMKLLDPRESPETQGAFLDFMRKIADLFDPDRQPFRFADGDYLKDLRALGFRFVGSVQYSAPAKQVLFLNRKLGGMFHMLKDFGFVCDLRVLVDRVMAMEITEPPK